MKCNIAKYYSSLTGIATATFCCISIEARESNLRWQSAGLMLYQLSYIPTLVTTRIHVRSEKDHLPCGCWLSDRQQLESVLGNLSNNARAPKGQFQTVHQAAPVLGKTNLGHMNWCYMRPDGFLTSCLVWDIQMELCRLLPSAIWLSNHKSSQDKMFRIICSTLEHPYIMQNASYFASNCVSIGHNIGDLLLFFVALYSENRSLVISRITKDTHFFCYY